MKVLHINTFDNLGGAARAAHRLHRALISAGISSVMLVQQKKGDDSTVVSAGGRFRKLISRVRLFLDFIPLKLYSNRQLLLFSPAWVPFSGILNIANKINPEIVHLHWICGGMLSIEELAKIKVPIIWTLHDNWAFTGGCHIMWECAKYKYSCGACPRLASEKENDLSRKVFLRKRKSFSQIGQISIVGVSRWLSECVENSSLLHGRSVSLIPNPLDINCYKPVQRGIAREILNLPKEKKLILFGAMSSTSDINKGFQQLNTALNSISSQNVDFVVFGSFDSKEPTSFPCKVHYFGRLHDDVALQILYSACDVMVVPSRQEAFGQTASEAMACGTPVVAFGHTGLLDIVDHKINGYLAAPLDTADLAAGIEWVLNAPNYAALCQNAREKVVREFDSRVIAERYIELYKEVLNG